MEVPVLNHATLIDNFFPQIFSLMVELTTASGISCITAYDKSLGYKKQNIFHGENLNSSEVVV